MPISLPNPRFYTDPTIWASHLVEVLEKELNRVHTVDLHKIGTARNPAFGAGWGVVAATMSPFFFKLDDLVVLGGVVERTGGGAPGANETIFNLPKGFRPESELRYVLGGAPGVQTVYIKSGGNVDWMAGAVNGASPWIDWLGLSMSFPAARV